MKNQKSVATLISICVIIFLVTFTFAKNSTAMSKPPAPKPAFAETSGWKKIDIRAKQAYQDFEKSGKDSTLDAIIKTTAKPNAQQKEALKKSGFTARTYIGKIITGSINLSDLPDMSNLDFVEVVEMSVPMSLKKNRQTPLK